MTRLVVAGVILAVGAIVLLIALIRTRRLNERYALLWLVAALGVILFGLWPAALEALAGIFGIAYPPSALFLLVGVLLGLVLLDSAVAISKLEDRVETLAQHLAITEERLRRLEAGADDQPGDPPPPPSSSGS
jgi:hypothetical protein